MEASTSKPVHDDDARKLLQHLRRHPEGATSAVLEKELKWSAQRLATTLNPLLQAFLVLVMRREGDDATLSYKLSPSDTSLKNLNDSEWTLLHLISETTSSGIWSKDLRTQAGMTPSVFSKAIKGLENRSLIKSVKAVNALTKKRYMLSNIEPSTEITGGAWYTAREFDMVRAPPVAPPVAPR